MTVQDLIDELQKLPEKDRIIYSLVATDSRNYKVLRREVPQKRVGCIEYDFDKSGIRACSISIIF